MSIVKVEHLTRVFGKGENEVCALDDVSFSIEKGEFVSVMGRSGSGKSTLMHIMGGVDRPSDGQVYVENTDLSALNESQIAIFRRRHIGLVYQFYNLIPTLTVRENVELPQLLDRQKVDDKFSKKLLETLSLADRADHLPSQLSGGQEQRAAIGRALINRPAIVLADEPTGNLDRENSRDIMALLKTCNKHFGQTLMVITHDKEVALQADRILVLDDGHIVKDEVVRA